MCGCAPLHVTKHSFYGFGKNGSGFNSVSLLFECRVGMNERERYLFCYFFLEN